jgi:hypothetical protein
MISYSGFPASVKENVLIKKTMQKSLLGVFSEPFSELMKIKEEV